MGFFTKLFSPRVARQRTIVEERSWVMVYDVPVGAGWRLNDHERAGEDFVLQILELVHAEEQLVLLAKDYATAVEGTVADLEARDWDAQYAQIFDEVTGVRVSRTEQMLMDRTVPAFEIVANGTTEIGPQRIRERYSYVPGHQLIISAVGAGASHERQSADIERWFAGVTFRPAP